MDDLDNREYVCRLALPITKGIGVSTVTRQELVRLLGSCSAEKFLIQISEDGSELRLITSETSSATPSIPAGE